MSLKEFLLSFLLNGIILMPFYYFYPFSQTESFKRNFIYRYLFPWTKCFRKSTFFREESLNNFHLLLSLSRKYLPFELWKYLLFKLLFGEFLKQFSLPSPLSMKVFEEILIWTFFRKNVPFWYFHLRRFFNVLNYQFS